VELRGPWTLDRPLPSLGPVEAALARGGVERLRVTDGGLGEWDSSVLVYIEDIEAMAAERGALVDTGALPRGIRTLLELARSARGRPIERVEQPRPPLLVRVGDRAVWAWRGAVDGLEFGGEVAAAVWRFVRGRARYRRSDLLLAIQQCGAGALPIVSLLNFLVGLILGFVAATQLREWGAEIFVANLVGIGMVRALAAVVTGVTMAGRTGASFAAQLGTMQVNEEIDALRTFGIPPAEFLVLPRMMALGLMMPLLALYAVVVGLLGGAVVGISLLHFTLAEYAHQTYRALDLTDLGVGIFSAAVFGVLVALAGCYKGLRCGRSAAAVGEATTSAVVIGIVSIVVAMAFITWGCNILGI